MKLVIGKYSTVMHENGKPINVSLTATFVEMFENDKRWFARIKPLGPFRSALQRIYTESGRCLEETIVVKVPYRYKRFECYVSKYGVASSVYELRNEDTIDCNMTMTHIDENVHWKINNINIISLKEP